MIEKCNNYELLINQIKQVKLKNTKFFFKKGVILH